MKTTGHDQYCTCGAETVEDFYGPETMDDEMPPISNQAHFQDHTVIGLPTSFFAYNKTSILYQHNTIRCPFRLDCGPIKKIPPIDIGVKTRQMTTQTNLVQNNYTEEKKHKSPSSKTPPPITNNKSQKLLFKLQRKQKRVPPAPNLRKQLSLLFAYYHYVANYFCHNIFNTIIKCVTSTGTHKFTQGKYIVRTNRDFVSQIRFCRRHHRPERSRCH